MSSRAYQIL